MNKKYYLFVGEKWGNWTLLESAGSSWYCVCDCGTYKHVKAGSLATGTSKSCGCLKQKPFGEASFNGLYTDYKINAKVKKKPFRLTKDQFKTLTSSNCFYCGVQPSQVRQTKKNSNGKYYYNGIDRIDNVKGYVIENCRPCCGICNKAKRDLTEEEFNQWLIRLVKFQYLTKGL